MVKKLIKYEFIYYFRTIGIAMPILIAASVVAKLLSLLNTDNILISVLLLSSSLIVQSGPSVLLILTAVVAISRFYKNMYTAEGYLTLTLPVTYEQHIFVKLLGALTCGALSLIAVGLSYMILMIGEPLVTSFQTIGFALKELYANMDALSAVLYTFEIVLLALILALSAPLFFYTCITLGQMAKKNRILSAVGVYFLCQIILGPVGLIPLAIIPNMLDTAAVRQFIADHPVVFAHISIWGIIVIGAGLCALYYFITLRVMKKKLNLE